MEIILKPNLDIKKELTEFISTEEIKDGFSCGINIASNSNYYKDMPSFIVEYDKCGSIIGLCHLFSVNKREVEVSILVASRERRHGLSTQLLAEAKSIISNYDFKKILYICDDASTFGKAFLEKLKVKPHHTEYILALSKDIELPRASRLLVSTCTTNDLEKVIEINSEAFDEDYEVTSFFIESVLDDPSKKIYVGKLNYNPICSLMLNDEDSSFSMTGVATSSSLQRQGYAKELICEVLNSINAVQKNVYINVESQNSPAYSLYKSVGFDESKILNYYIENL